MSHVPPIPPPEDFELGVFVRSFLSGLPAVQPPLTFEDAVLRAVHRTLFTPRNWAIVVVILGLIVGLVYWVSFHNVRAVDTPRETVPNFNVTRPSLPLIGPKSNLSALDSPIIITPTFEAIILPVPTVSIIVAPRPSGKKRVSSRLKGVAGY